MIQKLKLLGRHVDLSHILTVSEAYFDDRMGSGGWFVGFSIQFALVDNPTHYTWQAEDCGGVRFREEHEVQYADGTWSNSPDLKGHGLLVPIMNLNKRIEEEVVQPWKLFKGQIKLEIPTVHTWEGRTFDLLLPEERIRAMDFINTEYKEGRLTYNQFREAEQDLRDSQAQSICSQASDGKHAFSSQGCPAGMQACIHCEEIEL